MVIASISCAKHFGTFITWQPEEGFFLGFRKRKQKYQSRQRPLGSVSMCLRNCQDFPQLEFSAVGTTWRETFSAEALARKLIKVTNSLIRWQEILIHLRDRQKNGRCKKVGCNSSIKSSIRSSSKSSSSNSFSSSSNSSSRTLWLLGTGSLTDRCLLSDIIGCWMYVWVCDT